MTNKQIVASNLKIYEPQFDEDEDRYIDTNPFKKYERSIISYECKCRAGTCFTNNTQYKMLRVASNTCEILLMTGTLIDSEVAFFQSTA